MNTVHLLFSLCGNAQACAAFLVCRDALMLEADAQADAARELLVQVETLREQVWRVLLDWPVLIGQLPEKTVLAALLKCNAQFKFCLFANGDAFNLNSSLDIDKNRLNELKNELTALVDATIFNGRLGDFQTLDNESQLRHWLDRNTSLPAKILNEFYRLNWQELGRNEIACLPELDLAILHQQLQQENLCSFVKTPNWQGQRWETTPLNRQQSRPLIFELQNRYGNGLLVRFVAVLLEITAIIQRLNLFVELRSNFFIYSANGIHLAQVQAARGLLLHRLELRQGLVYDYRIVAPTEWNFQPEGVVAQGLNKLQAANADSLRRQAEWLIRAVDPCVQYGLNLVEDGYVGNSS